MKQTSAKMIQGGKIKPDAEVPFSAASGHEQVALDGLLLVIIETVTVKLTGSWFKNNCDVKVPFYDASGH